MSAVAAAIGLTSAPALAGTCTINITANSQTIDGFGCSSAWSGTLTSAQNNSLYSTLGFSILRVRIDENNNWGEETANASAAHAAGAKVLGSPWFAPSSLRDSSQHLAPSHYGDYANWLNSAISSIGIDVISIQNEPDYTSWMNWSATEIFNFMKNNAGVLSKPVCMPESFHFSDSYSDPVINDSTAVNHFTYLGGHIYGGGNSVHQNAINHGKHVWMTEHYINGASTNITTAITMAKEVSDCMNNQMSAYIWWWLNSGSETRMVDGSGAIHKSGYILGQWAKWVRPGKQRVSATYNPTSNVYTTAYHNGGIVIVAVNTGTSSVSQTFTIQNASGVTSFLVNRTSSSENMAGKTTASVANNTFSYTLPAQSVTTFHQF